MAGIKIDRSMPKTTCYLDGKLASLCGTGYRVRYRLETCGMFFLLFISNYMSLCQRKNVKISKIWTYLMYTSRQPLLLKSATGSDQLVAKEFSITYFQILYECLWYSIFEPKVLMLLFHNLINSQFYKILKCGHQNEFSMIFRRNTDRNLYF